jgi:hypothetical protein
VNVLTRTRDDGGGGGGNLASLRSAAEASRAHAGFKNDRDPTTSEEERYWKALGKARLSSNVRVNGILTRTREPSSGAEGDMQSGFGGPISAWQQHQDKAASSPDPKVRRAAQIAESFRASLKNEPWFADVWLQYGSAALERGPAIQVSVNSTIPDASGQNDYDRADLALPLSIDSIPIDLWHHDVGLSRGSVHRDGMYSVSQEKLAALRARDALAAQLGHLDVRGATVEKPHPQAPPVLRVKVATPEDAKQIPEIAYGILIAVELVAAIIPVAAVLVAGNDRRVHGSRVGTTVTPIPAKITKVDANGVPWIITELAATEFMGRSTTYSPPANVYGSSLGEIDKKINAYASTHSITAIFSSVGHYIDENNGIWFRTDRWAPEFPGDIPAGKRYVAKTASYRKVLGSSTDQELYADTEMALKDAIDAFALAHRSGKKLILPSTLPPVPPEDDTSVSDEAPPAEDDTSVSDSIDDVAPDKKPPTLTEATLPPPNPAVAAAIKAAAAVLDRSPWKRLITAAGRQELLGVGLLENLYGTKSDWFFMTPEGKWQPAYNWGATVARKGDLFVLHTDRKTDGSKTTRKFAAFRTADEGFARFWAIFAKPDTLTSANDGNATDTAAAMYGHGYFGGVTGSAFDRIERYAKAIKGASDVVANVLGEAKLVRLEGAPILVKRPVGGGGVLLAGAAILGLGILAVKAAT